MMTATNELWCSVLAIVLALKYQIVASSMSQYVTGNLDSIKHARNIKLVFGTLLLASLISFIVYLVRSVKITQG